MPAFRTTTSPTRRNRTAVSTFGFTQPARRTHPLDFGRAPARSLRVDRLVVEHRIDDPPRFFDVVLTREHRLVAGHRVAENAFVGVLPSSVVGLRLATVRPPRATSSVVGETVIPIAIAESGLNRKRT